MNSKKQIEIIGNRVLKGGKVPVAGSSNQVTKCMIAALLTEDAVTLKGCPNVNERHVVEGLLKSLGAEIENLDEHDIRIHCRNRSEHTISKEHCQKNRISILAIPPLLHKFKKATLGAPLGGDKIGQRPVNFHIKGLQEMGAEVEYDDKGIHFSTGPNGLHGAHIVLPFPSVMTTENLILAAVLAKGRTIIENAATEPEIIELTRMLQKMGADIMVSANRTFVIQGVEKLRGCELRVMVDRNEAVSLAVAAIATGGNVLLQKVPHGPVYSFLNFLQRMGGEFKINSEGLYVSAPQSKKLIGAQIEVEVHPGFMTDWQQPFMVLFTQAKGTSVLHETVFEERLGYTKILNEMGADITLFSCCLGEAPCRYRNRNFVHSAIIKGPTPLHATNVSLPTDIRAGMCVVVAALVAEGKSTLTNIHELERKYDNLVHKLEVMGADIKVT